MLRDSGHPTIIDRFDWNNRSFHSIDSKVKTTGVK